VRVPAEWTAAGTLAAIVVLATWVGMTAVGRAGCVVVVVATGTEVVVVEVLELLEHAVATRAKVPSATAATVCFIPRVELRTGEPPRSS
jgi:3-hydroxyacyl-CoA dehydrogenase